MIRFGRFSSTVVVFASVVTGILAAPAVAERFGAGSFVGDVLTSFGIQAQAAQREEANDSSEKLTPAATLTVTKTADTNDGVCDADCSLREAVAAAAPGDSIVFGSPLFDTPQIVTTNGQIVINKALTITGKGAFLTTVANFAPAAATTRVFFVTGNPVTLSSMTISGGAVNQFDPSSGCEICGGGILNTGNLTLNSMVFSGNNVSGTVINGLRSGGAVNTTQNSVLTVIGSTFTNNSVTGPGQNFGGALYSAGTLRISNSTITGNTVSTSANGQASGGGIVREGGTAVLINTTIANNTLIGASSVGDFCNGGGVFQSGNFFGDFTALNVIFANNSIDNCQISGPDFSGTLNSLGNNLIGNTAGANIVGTTTGNILNQSPGLGPLGYYGGTVFTLPVANSSPVGNAGNNCVLTLTCAGGNNPPIALTTDQRGAARFGNVDIGAYETNISFAGGTYRAPLPGGRQEFAYTTTLIPNVGTFTNVSVGAGALPNGVTLQTSGNSRIIAGTPTQAGTFNFSLNIQAPTGTITVDYTMFVANENIPPETTITATPAILSNNPNPSFSFTGSDSTTSPANMTFECSLDSAPFTPCSSPQTFNGVADGPHNFAVRARDEAGNVDPTPSTFAWTIETVAPFAPVIAYPADLSLIFINQPTITGTAEPNSTVTVLLDNVLIGTEVADGAGNWSKPVPAPLADGFHSIRATATDAAGNVSPESVSNFRVATNAPTLGTYPNQTINLAGNATFVPLAASTGAQTATASTSADFKGEIEVDPLTGNIRVTNAYPAGTYNVTVRVSNPFGAETRNFTLTVQTVTGCAAFDTSAFAPRVTYPANANPTAVTTGDFNADGRLDIATANQNISEVAVMLRNAANTGFEAPISLIPQEQPSNIEVGDFNGDGRQDLATANFRGHSVSVFLRNIQNTGFLPAQNIALNPFSAPGRQPLDIAVGDVNGDGRYDIVTANFNGSGISVLVRNAANTGFDAPVDYPTGGLGRSVEFSDFNGDGRQDLVVVNQIGTISVFLRDVANSDFQPRTDYGGGSNPSDATTGDFNGDGKQDIVFGSIVDSTVSVMLRNAANTDFEPRVTYATPGTTRSLVTGDFNHDGKQDIAFTVGSTAQVMLRNAANTGFDTAVGFGAGNTALAVDIGDFNGDNRQDLVAVNLNDATVSVLQRQCPVDTVPPDTTITANPNNPSNSSSANFTFTGNDNVTPPASLTFECALDSPTFSACTSPQSFTGLVDGNHSFRVRAIDQAGITDPTPAVFNWTIDATAPTVVLSSSAPDPTNTAFNVTATFSESVSGFDLSDISVGNGAPGNLSGSGNLYTFTVTPAAPGLVSVFVGANAAQDVVGNQSTASNQLTRQFNDQTVLIVTKTADTNDGVCNGDCSLREAISAATTGTVISFAPLFGSPQTITLANGELLIDKDVSIVGTGANFLTVSGNNASRVFQVNNATASINSLTVRGGNADNGGGVYSFGSQLTITNSVIVGNTVSGNAGGLYNIFGTLNLVDSTVSGNNAAAFGGGIANGGAPSVLNVTNSTISGNSASSGGGVFASGEINVRSSTVAFNSATTEGGGIANFTFEPVRLGNTIVAGNTAPAAPDFRDTLTSLGYNLIGSTNGTILAGDATGNVLNQDAQFAPLGFYGGRTLTHALLASSPAVNAGTGVNAPVNDQRGAARVGNVDIGAFELNNSENGGNYRATLPGGSVNVPYSFTIVPNNGTTTYAVTGGTLPNGVSLTTNLAPSAVVAVAGTPTNGGVFNFSVTATNGPNTNVTDYSLNVFGPTAAGVSVSGLVATSDGRGLRNATVRMTDANGVTRSARTGTFGYFRFEDVESGQVMTFTVKAKRANFAPQVVYIGDEVVGLEFVAEEWSVVRGQ